jgi:hypothetical protein
MGDMDWADSVAAFSEVVFSVDVEVVASVLVEASVDEGAVASVEAAFADVSEEAASGCKAGSSVSAA